MAISDEEPDASPEIIDIVDWHALFNRTDSDEEAIIDGLAFRGRWTALASPAKAGKSTILLALAVDATKAGHVVIYIDAEMGRGDVLDRVQDWMDLKPADLADLHYCDLPPKLDNIQGATALWNTVEKVAPDLVIIDGLNGVVNGAENDDTTWRDMYEWAIAPLKQRNVAVISADNMGHGDRKGPRGSSVKLDKADAIIVMERTETGVKMTATHRRTASYPGEQEYTVTDADECGKPMTVRRVGSGSHALPEGTKRINRILDELGAAVDITRRPARQLLKEHGYEAPRNADLGAMLKWRREQITTLQLPVDKVVPGPVGTTGTSSRSTLKVVPESGDHSEETPGRSVVPDGGPSYRDHHHFEAEIGPQDSEASESKEAVDNPPAEHDPESPFG